MIGRLAREGALGDRFKSKAERFEVLPVQWRTTLTLDHGTIGQITPEGLEWLRKIFNTTALDVLYFTSPRYSQVCGWGLQRIPASHTLPPQKEIMDTVTDRVNATYKEFV